MKELKIYRCDHCKNIVVKIHDGGVVPVCCGETMKELVPNTVDASVEKHVPIVTRENNQIIVHVGSEDHPMLDAHYIEWVLLETKTGFRVIYLQPNDQPTVQFYEDEPVIAVYAYCNLHGLWKTSV